MDKKLISSLILNVVGIITIICTSSMKQPCKITNSEREIRQYIINNKQCQHVNHLSHHTSIARCSDSYIIGRKQNNDLVGIKLTFDEFKNICKQGRTERSRNTLECISIKNLSDVTKVYFCPDYNYIIQNEDTLFLLKHEFDRICLPG